MDGRKKKSKYTNKKNEYNVLLPEESSDEVLESSEESDEILRSSQEFDELIEPLKISSELSDKNKFIYENSLLIFERTITTAAQITVENYYKRALIHFKFENYNAAITDLDEAIKIEKKYADAYNLRGMSFSKLNKYNEAIEEFNQASKIDLCNNDPIFNRGCIYEDYYNDTKKAIADYKKAILINPKSESAAKAYYRLGLISYKNNKKKTAMQRFTLAISIDKDFAETYLVQGNLYFEMGKTKQALINYIIAIKLKPDYIEAYISRAALFIKEKRISDAIEDYSTIISIDPYYPEIRLNRAICYLKQNKQFDAFADLCVAIKLKPTLPTAHFLRGKIYWKIKNYSNALLDLNEANQLNPDDPSIYLYRASVYRKMGKLDLAFDEVNKAISFKPTPQAYQARGVIHYQSNRIREALIDLNRALESKPGFKNAIKHLENILNNLTLSNIDSVPLLYRSIKKLPHIKQIPLFKKFVDEKTALGKDFWSKKWFGKYDANYSNVLDNHPDLPIIRFKRALTRLEEKNFTNAYKDLSLVLLLNPLHQQAYYYRAITYKYCGAYTHAISDLNQAQELAFENSLLYLQRGICYKFIGNFKFAIADLDKAQELDPENSIIYYERGLTYKKMAQYKPAIKDLKRVLKINPENSLAMLKLGSIYSKNSKSTLAIKAMDTIIEANPETYQAYKIRGINLYLQEKIEDAIKDLTKSLQLKPDYRDAAIRLEHILNNLTSTNVEKINKFIIQIAIFKLPETMQIPLLKKCLDKTTILGQYFAKFKKSENNNSAINTLNQKKTEKEDMDRVIDSIIASIKQINFDDSATDSISQMISRLKLIDPKFKLSEIAPTVKNIFENNSQLQNASSELTSTPNNAAFKL